MEATRASVTSGNENYYNMEPTYQTGYTQQEVEGKEILKNYNVWLFLPTCLAYFPQKSKI